MKARDWLCAVLGVYSFLILFWALWTITPA